MKKITFEEANERFKDRNDIVLIEDGYNGWKNKSKFWDNIQQEYFCSIPSNVYKQKSSPLRKLETYKNTCLKLYNVENTSQLKKIKNKINQTFKEKYNKNFIITFEEARKKLIDKNRDDIELIEYNGWSKKSKFLNKITNEYFFHKPANVFNQKTKYNKRNSIQKISFIEAHERFVEQGRIDIKLCENEYNGWKNKSKFYDKIEKDYFWSIPSHVYMRKSVHPARRDKKHKQTCVEKYGFEHHLQSNIQKRKISNRFIKEYNVHVKDWLALQPEPKPSNKIINHNFPNKEISIEELHQFIQNYKNNKTSLEIFTENLFNIKHYNKKPKEITKLYKPDFKLSDKIYLNVDGLYWHTEEQKGKWYHYKLREEFERVGLRIFQFYDYEIYNKSNIVKSIINNSLGIFNEKIDSENYSIQKIEQNIASKFLINNHLLGTVVANHIGLYKNKQLISLLSYNINNNKCIIERFCSVTNNNIIDDFSKLLSNLENLYLNFKITEIHSWTDLRFENEEYLLKNNFIKIKDILEYKWTDYKIVFNKKIFQKNKLYKIYDAGQRLHIKFLS